MIWLFPIALAVAAQAPAQSATRTPVTAFVHVGVVPMDDTNRVLLDQTVLVRGTRIVALGPAAKVTVPAGATRIDGRGKYLLPGLADMHAHVGGLGAPGTKMSDAVDQLFLYAANGVTTIRNLNYYGGFDSLILKVRAQAAAGQLWSPRIYASSQWLMDPKQSYAQNLAAYQAAGFDLIKVHDGEGESGAPLDSLAIAAHRLGLPIVGHVSGTDLLEHALDVHFTSIEHLTGYPTGDSLAGLIGRGIELADTVKLPALIAATARAGVWNCPTQVMMELWETDPDTWPERRFGPTATNGVLLKSADSLHVIRWKVRQRIIRELQAAGAGLLLGTDAPLLVPGFSIHRELQALVRAGLTPYQALATGTRNIAAYFGKLREEGTIAVGKRADLVLLTGNPLMNIEHTMNPAGAMFGGRWLSRAVIDRRLTEIARRK